MSKVTKLHLQPKVCHSTQSNLSTGYTAKGYVKGYTPKVCHSTQSNAIFKDMSTAEQPGYTMKGYVTGYTAKR